MTRYYQSIDDIGDIGKFLYNHSKDSNSPIVNISHIRIPKDHLKRKEKEFGVSIISIRSERSKRIWLLYKIKTVRPILYKIYSEASWESSISNQSQDHT